MPPNRVARTVVNNHRGGSAEQGKPQPHEAPHENWLQVFRRADASRMGQGRRKEGHTKAVRSEICVRFRRTSAMVCGPHAPAAQTARPSVFSSFCKGFKRCPKLTTSSIALAPIVPYHRQPIIISDAWKGGGQ